MATSWSCGPGAAIDLGCRGSTTPTCLNIGSLVALLLTLPRSNGVLPHLHGCARKGRQVGVENAIRIGAKPALTRFTDGGFGPRGPPDGAKAAGSRWVRGPARPG